VIDKDAMRQRWETVGSKTSAVDDCSRRVRCERPAGVALDRLGDHRARTFDDLPRRGRSSHCAAAAGPGATQGRRSLGALTEQSATRFRLQAPHRTRHFGRSHAAFDLGIQEHGQTRSSADRDGASDQRFASPMPRRMQARWFRYEGTSRAKRRKPAVDTASGAIVG
jgi:hypothetical protein